MLSGVCHSNTSLIRAHLVQIEPQGTSNERHTHIHTQQTQLEEQGRACTHAYHAWDLHPSTCNPTPSTKCMPHALRITPGLGPVRCVDCRLTTSCHSSKLSLAADQATSANSVAMHPHPKPALAPRLPSTVTTVLSGHPAQTTSCKLPDTGPSPPAL